MTPKVQSNIVLVGFMGCGKTRVGELLAKTLGYNLIDTDALIEVDQGLSIKDIFTLKGESYFRELEHDILKRLDSTINSVIVTGGGMPMRYENLELLKNLGHIFYLDANFSLILSRVKRNKKRPKAGDKHELKSLFSFRRTIYESIGHSIDVNHQIKRRTCEEIAKRFKAMNDLACLPKLRIDSTHDNYYIYLQEKVLTKLDDVIHSLGLEQNQIALVTSDTLRDILGEKISSINNSRIITIKDGEQHKDQHSIDHIHQELIKHGFTRQTLIIALGGGNVGDVAGFAAATYMRGVPLIQIPTTLLSMVDSSIGGKTGIDMAEGKNLVGAFHNPSAVLIDPDFLKTLPAHEYSSGMAEVIKHAIIGDKKLFFELQKNQLSHEQIISRALKVKADIVFCDPKEKSIRAHLNLGHTFAHAIEKVSGYEISHGFAVAMGLVLATKLSKHLNILAEDFLADLQELLTNFNLPCSLPSSLDKGAIINAMQQDKKRDTSGLKFIVPKKLGQVDIQHVSNADITLSMS